MTTQQFHKSLNLHYIHCEKGFLLENGVIVTKEELSNKTLKQQKALINKKLKTDKLYDYTRSIAVGTLVEKQLEPVGKVVNETFLIPLIGYSLLLVSVGACIASVFFTYHFLLTWQNSYISLLLSIIMVIFSSTAFAVADYLKKQKHRFFVFMYLALWVITVSFSMYSTVAVNYASYKEKYYENITESSVANANRSEKEILQIKKENVDKEIDILKEQIAYNEEQGWGTYTFRKQLAEKQAEQGEILDREIILIQETPDITVTDSSVEETNIVYMLGEHMGIDGDMLQFIISTLPAVFIDLIAPLCLGVSVILIGKKKEENE